MSINNKIKVRTRKKKPTLSKLVWGWLMFLTSVFLFPLVFGITYYQNRKYNYKLKYFFKAYLEALKEMLLGTWRY